MPPLYAHDPFLAIHTALHVRWLDGPMAVLSDACLGLPVGLIGLALFVWQELASRERAERGLSFWRALWEVLPALGALLAGLLAGGIANYYLKDFFDWPRPLHFYPGQVHVLGEPLYVKGFPSGHATSAAVMATVATCAYGRKLALAWALPLLGGLARIYVGAHFAADVAAGWGLGAFLGGAAYLAEVGLAPRGRLARLRAERRVRRNALDTQGKPP